jgi:hypothetical protein
VAHGQYAAQAMTKLGKTTVNAHYPNDHTHTDAYLANVMAGTSPVYLVPSSLSLPKSLDPATRIEIMNLGCVALLTGEIWLLC